MGCTCSKASSPQSRIELSFDRSVVNLPTTPSYDSFKASVLEQFPALRLNAWFLFDPLTAVEIKTSTQYTTYLGRTQGRTAGHLSVKFEQRLQLPAESPLLPLLPNILGVFGKDHLLCSGVYLGKLIALVATSCPLTDSVFVFRSGAEEALVPFSANTRLFPLGKTGIAVVRLTPPTGSVLFLSKLSGVMMPWAMLDVKKGDKLLSLFLTARTPVVRAAGCVVIEEPESGKVVVMGRMGEGAEGSPVFGENGVLVGVVARSIENDKHECVPIARLIEHIKELQSFPEAEDLVAGTTLSQERSKESIDLAGISLEEDRPFPTLAIHDNSAIQIVTRQRVQATEQPPVSFEADINIDEGSEHSPVSVSPSPPSPPSIKGECRAFFLNSVDGGSELWRLAKTDYSLSKESSPDDVPRGCCLLDTPQGLLAIGGEESAGRKVQVWTKSGLRQLGGLKTGHAKHAAVLVGRHVYVISGSSTACVEIFDIWTCSPALVRQLPKTRYLAGACSVSQHSLFLAGGFVGSQGRPGRSILEYKVQKDEWTKLGLKLSAPVTAVGLVYVAPQTLLVIGGRSAQGTAQSEAYLLDLQASVCIASLSLPEPATFAHTHPVRDEDSLVMFTDSKLRFEYDIRRQRFYLLSV